MTKIKSKNPPFQVYWDSAWPRAGPCQAWNGERSTSTCTCVQMVPSLLSWQGRRMPGNLQAAFHTKAQNVPAFLFLKVPPASCVPHTDLVCALCRSPVLSRREPSTIHMRASLQAFNLKSHRSLFLSGRMPLTNHTCHRSPVQCSSWKPLAMCQPLLHALSPVRSISFASWAWPPHPKPGKAGLLLPICCRFRDASPPPSFIAHLEIEKT